MLRPLAHCFKNSFSRVLFQESCLRFSTTSFVEFDADGDVHVSQQVEKDVEPTFVNRKVTVPKDACRFIIGRQGQMIKCLQAASQCYLKVKDGDQYSDIEITGLDRNMDRAVKYINFMTSLAEMRRNEEVHSLHENEVMQELQVPNSKFGLVAGKFKNVTVKAIVEFLAQCRIRFGQPSSTGAPVVEFYGHPDNIKKAIEMMEFRIECSEKFSSFTEPAEGEHLLNVQIPSIYVPFIIYSVEGANPKKVIELLSLCQMNIVREKQNSFVNIVGSSEENTQKAKIYIEDFLQMKKNFYGDTLTRF